MTKVDWDGFFVRLDALPKGSRVALKRAAGTMLQQTDGRTMRIFYQCLPDMVAPWQEDRAFFPQISDRERAEKIRGWQRAVERARGWTAG